MSKQWKLMEDRWDCVLTIGRFGPKAMSPCCDAKMTAYAVDYHHKDLKGKGLMWRCSACKKVETPDGMVADEHTP